MVALIKSHRMHIIIIIDALAFGSAAFGQGSGSIHLDEVRCLGTEHRLLDCPHTTLDDCSHFEDAGVRCNTTSEWKFSSNGDFPFFNQKKIPDFSYQHSMNGPIAWFLTLKLTYYLQQEIKLDWS